MEQTVGKPIIIEFNGLPGCGKTTTMLEIRKLLKHLDVRELNSNKLIEGAGNRKKILFTKEVRYDYLLFLRSFLLIRPISKERYRMMKMTFRYWCGIKNATSRSRKPEICVFDQAVIQGIVSIAYKGNIRNKEKWLTYIKRIMSGLDNVICVNCEIEPSASRTRMEKRKKKVGRLYLINNNKALDKVLSLQAMQFKEIREVIPQKAVTINMHDPAEDNAKKIIDYLIQSKLVEENKK